ncbi:peptide-methionine (S)-S-oxide reductase MsrA [Aquisalimonas sp.]|uniref:peptide-methionine (S)-S-oxide reductase MsrA n=1 Tax=unclassified Aquisalimonas TaxID=2644645 RepID=UPI0025BC0EF8|nr:peptide-methionine (S)-S-oxide reductase MsrA [Aquisalimonas sp.]
MKRLTAALAGAVGLLLGVALTGVAVADERQAVFAGGCFWCMQPPYDELDGVLGTEVGYTGGHVEEPTYEQVTAGDTGHLEAVRVTYDPERIDYESLLEVFWRNIDPLDDGGQFCDRGGHYRAAIFVANEAEREQAEASLQALEASGRFEDPIVTRIRDADTFYLAEDYHQDYYQNRPLRYRFYRTSCGRDARLDALWGD